MLLTWARACGRWRARSQRCSWQPARPRTCAHPVSPVDQHGIHAAFTRACCRCPHARSPYLAAFAVGRFDYVEANDNGVRFRVYTPPGKAAFATFALDFTVKVTRYYSDNWRFNYADMNDKMDQIAVPAIQDNAMENWGLLTYGGCGCLVLTQCGLVLWRSAGARMVASELVASTVRGSPSVPEHAPTLLSRRLRVCLLSSCTRQVLSVVPAGGRCQSTVAGKRVTGYVD